MSAEIPFEDNEEPLAYCACCKLPMYKGEILYNGFCEDCVDEYKYNMTTSAFAEAMDWTEEEL